MSSLRLGQEQTVHEPFHEPLTFGDGIAFVGHRIDRVDDRQLGSVAGGEIGGLLQGFVTAGKEVVDHQDILEAFHRPLLSYV